MLAMSSQRPQDHKYKASGLVIVMLALGFHSKPKVLPYKLLRPSKLIAEAQHPMLTNNVWNSLLHLGQPQANLTAETSNAI